MSSAAAPTDKFQPTWIRSAFHGPGNGGSLTNSPRVSTNEEEPFIEPCPAVLAKNRYGREELLVLQPKPLRTPSGLEKCPIYNEDFRAPVVTTPITEHEQRLQMNINSSKAMSSLNQSDRMAVATGGSPNGPNSPQIKGNQWTPVKGPSNWGRGASQMGPGTGLNGRANLTRPLGRGSPLNQVDEQQSLFGQKYVPRGRGGAVAGRGASTTAGAAQINSRAQGLYDPRDPKDRPRNRLRSTSDDTEPADPDNGGWSQVSRFGRQNSSNAWNTREEGTWNAVERENSFTAVPKQENGVSMPEWFDDGDESEKPAENAGGSFDDDGRYRQPKENHAPPSHWKLQQQNSASSQQERPLNGPQQPPVPNSFNASTSVEAGPTRVVEFFYLDPTETERGPFTKDQMYTWYTMNYFKDDLKVRRKEDTQYKTLGELKVLNGHQTVFDYKPSPPPAAVPGQSFGFSGNPGFTTKTIFGAPNVWNEAMFPGPAFNSNVGAAFDEKDMLAEKQRYEMQKMSPEYQMMMMRAKEVEERTRAAQEKEMELRKQALILKKYEEEMMKKQMEQLELEKKMEAMQAANEARLEEERRRHDAELKLVEEKTRRDEEARRAELKKIEEEKRRMEEESRRKEAEMRRKQEEEERRRRAEEAAEEHRKLLQKKAEEDAAKIRRMQAEAERERQERARREADDQKVAKDVERMLNSEDVWSSSVPTTPATDFDTPWQTASTKKSPPQKPKTAPWSTSSQAASREKTLREIQEEEERQQAAEARELARQRKEQEVLGTPASMQSGTWANASQRISWNSSNAGKTSGKPAWGGAGVDAKPAVSVANWDGPSLQAANKIVQSSAPTTKKSAPASAKPAPIKVTAKVPSVDPFTQWVTKRLKEINTEVDADVLSSFLESVENPNEVEDYIEGYLGSSKSAKEFVKEYLQKRSESRKRRDTDKDDLSSASQAGTGTGGTQGKKKKNKGARLIVDGSCLGFRATGDPNRVNQGEIETVFSSSQKR